MVKKLVLVVMMCVLEASCSSGNVGNGEYVQSEPSSMTDQMSVTMYPVCLAKPFNGLVAIANVTPANDRTTTDLFCFDIKTSKIQWETVIENGTHGKLSYSGFEDAVYVRQDSKLKKIDLASENCLGIRRKHYQCRKSVWRLCLLHRRQHEPGNRVPEQNPHGF